MKARLNARLDWGGDRMFPVVVEAARDEKKAQIRLSLEEARELGQSLIAAADEGRQPIKRTSPSHWRVGRFEVQRFGPDVCRVVDAGTRAPMEVFEGPGCLRYALDWALTNCQGPRGA